MSTILSDSVIRSEFLLRDVLSELVVAATVQGRPAPYRRLTIEDLKATAQTLGAPLVDVQAAVRIAMAESWLEMAPGVVGQSGALFVTESGRRAYASAPQDVQQGTQDRRRA